MLKLGDVVKIDEEYAETTPWIPAYFFLRSLSETELGEDLCLIESYASGAQMVAPEAILKKIGHDDGENT